VPVSRVVRSARASVTSFAAGLLTASLPFWLLGSGQLHGFGLPLPVSALMFVCPGVVATVFAAREAGRAGVLRLWRRSVDATAARHARSSGVAALLLPALVLVGSLFAHGSAALTSPWMPLTSVVVLVVVYLVAALVEEVGWTAHLTDRLEGRLGTRHTALVVGSLWAVWHVVPYVQAGHDLEWIAWQCLATVAARVLIVDRYRASGRLVPVAVVMHAGLNVASAVVPLGGPDYDPTGPAAVLSLVAAASIVRRGQRPRDGRAAT
jgi:membrane protease YdiL (CAAX protease family)